jgi:hypothetical protein
MPSKFLSSGICMRNATIFSDGSLTSTVLARGEILTWPRVTRFGAFASTISQVDSLIGHCEFLANPGDFADAKLRRAPATDL